MLRDPVELLIDRVDNIETVQEWVRETVGPEKTRMLAEKLGCTPGELSRKGVEVLSAGVFAMDGGGATRHAVDAADRLGADISRHRSRKLTKELINRADAVFCMTDFHVAEVARLVPAAAGKTRKLDDRGDIADPIGGGAGVYRRVAKRIEKGLRRALQKGLP